MKHRKRGRMNVRRKESGKTGEIKMETKDSKK